MSIFISFLIVGAIYVRYRLACNRVSACIENGSAQQVELDTIEINKNLSKQQQLKLMIECRILGAKHYVGF